MIKINNLCKTYDKNTFESTNALNGVTFDIEKGEIVSIIGKSGSGKTTLVNILLGITKPTSGEIIFNNELTINSKTHKKKLRKVTKFLLSSFQYPDHQIFTKKVKDEILFNSNDENYMFELMEKFDFEENLLERTTFKLSSGQKRKVILMSILIQKPKIIIFDEATSFLDPKSRREFTSLIKKINKELETTIIFISHNIDDIMKISNRVAIFDEGKLIDIGKPKKIIDFYLSGENNGKK